MFSLKSINVFCRSLGLMFLVLIAPNIAYSENSRDWGLSYQKAIGDDQNIAISYALWSGGRYMREWYLGCRQLNRKNTEVNLQEKAQGCGLAFTWRYYFPKADNFFLGVRNDWWRMKFEWEDAAVRNLQLRETVVDMLIPSFTFGWTFGKNKKANNSSSFDIYFSLGTEINLGSTEERISENNKFLTSIGLRF